MTKMLQYVSVTKNGASMSSDRHKSEVILSECRMFHKKIRKNCLQTKKEFVKMCDS